MNDLSKYAKYILNGDLVAIPTETVYGLGGNACDKSSILKIFKIKGRPRNNPLICHVHSFKFAEDNVFELSEKTRVIYKILTDKFWPGPLTLIAKKRANIVDEVAISGKVGVRCPNNALTLELLKLLPVPVAAPSANRSGHISPTSPIHVSKEFDQSYMNEIGINVWILDGGECCNVGIESTVLEYNEDGNFICIFRCGGISRKQIWKTLIDNYQNSNEWIKDIRINYFNNNKLSSSNYPPPYDSITVSPGMDIKHYSPTISTKLVAFVSDTQEYTAIKFDLRNVVLIDIGSKLSFLKCFVRYYFSLCDDYDFSLACKNLFSTLHKAEDLANSFDQPSSACILITGFETEDNISLALWDRVYRASCGEFIYCNLNEIKIQDKYIKTFYQNNKRQ
ncbi:SUA5 like RNA binding domain-containing protein [Cryptosporidium ubiquitum]|uniref:Threonylcarbamoyl-AMP synthase n=1 Tax=Cryptosporidium ubiquitum TaxID=857276 RepID=A0A1J4MP81_9CRYT|nr:SUA5 like RNA binding domain-containing protein [Cryptosporidium ubiquitum]OII74685.1 SUA5 like RNA binding domain-containing protein [Cryptosporidium ubiquitum]